MHVIAVPYKPLNAADTPEAASPEHAKIFFHTIVKRRSGIGNHDYIGRIIYILISVKKNQGYVWTGKCHPTDHWSYKGTDHGSPG